MISSTVIRHATWLTALGAGQLPRKGGRARRRPGGPRRALGTGSRDDEVEDDLFGQQVEEVPTIGDAIEALLDDAKERIERLEVVEVGDRRRHDAPRLCPRRRGTPGRRPSDRTGSVSPLSVRRGRKQVTDDDPDTDVRRKGDASA